MFDATKALIAILKGEVRAHEKEIPGRIATILLLANVEEDLLRVAVEGLVQKRFHVDEHLVREIYWAAPRRVRPAIVAATVVSYVAPSEYRRIWRDALRSARTTDERMRLAWSLDGFLNRNPAEAGHFVRPIRGFIRDENVTVKEIGLILLAFLRKVTTSEAEQVARGLVSRTTSTRLAALGTVQRWLVYADKRAPEVVAFACSEEVVTAARRAKRHRDAAVRSAARNYLRILRLRTAAWRAAGQRGVFTRPPHGSATGRAR